MRSFGRVAAAILCLAGCADATLDLLPSEKKPPADQDGGADAGASASDPGGQGGTTGGTQGAFGGLTGGGVSGGGTGGSGGFGAEPQAGAGADANNPCGPGNDSCVPHCRPLGCIACFTDEYCRSYAPSKPHCSSVNGCVECRPDSECPFGQSCAADCAPSERCDFETDACRPACTTEQDCPRELPACDRQQGRNVCVQCDFSHPCDKGLSCFNGTCGQCLYTGDNNCPDNAPICSSERRCVRCSNDNECNYQFTGRVCAPDGRCVYPP